jgi:nucleotide-binding universal stress UspA family protein
MTIRDHPSVAATTGAETVLPRAPFPPVDGVAAVPVTEAPMTQRAVPRAILVVYDGSQRAERAVADAVELCRDTNACLGLAVIRQRVVVFSSPWVCVATPISERNTCNGLLRRLPDDISVRFLSWPYPAGMRQIAELAKRLDCDWVLLPYSGWRARRAGRILARSDVAVLTNSARFSASESREESDGVRSLDVGSLVVREVV